MGATATAIAAYFSEAAVAETAVATTAEVAASATAAELGTAAAADYAAGLIPAGAAEAAGGTLGITAGGLKTAKDVAGLAVGLKALMPGKKPGVAPVVGMPDPKAQAEARRRSLAEQMSRRGRASTVLTNTLGG